MPEYIRGYITPQIIRKTTGSPAVNFIFSDVTESVLIDNLGSTAIYFTFDATATAGSSSGIIAASSFRAFDLRCGSISVMASGTSLTPEVMVVRLT